MTETKVSKIEAAERQIDVAIRLLFHNEDPIGIYTLAAAGFRILRDLGEKADTQIDQYLKKIIRPGMRGTFWKAFNRPANFLKHAKQDPDGILENFQEEANDVLILFACFYYKDLGYEWTPYMLAFVTWYLSLHQEIVELLIENLSLNGIAEDDEISALKAKPRTEQLAFGKIIVDRAFEVMRG